MTGREMINAWRFRWAYEDEERREVGWSQLAAQIDTDKQDAIAQAVRETVSVTREGNGGDGGDWWIHLSLDGLRASFNVGVPGPICLTVLKAIRARTP